VASVPPLRLYVTLARLPVPPSVSNKSKVPLSISEALFSMFRILPPPTRSVPLPQENPAAVTLALFSKVATIDDE